MIGLPLGVANRVARREYHDVPVDHHALAECDTIMQNEVGVLSDEAAGADGQMP
jgi:hypothetical protein